MGRVTRWRSNGYFDQAKCSQIYISRSRKTVERSQGSWPGKEDYETLEFKNKASLRYPGGTIEPGEYKFQGDLNSILIAPDWLLAEW